MGLFMIDNIIEEYAAHCEFQRAAHNVEDKLDLRIYTCEGTAYIQPLTKRGDWFIARYELTQGDYRPVRMTLSMIRDLTDEVIRRTVRADLRELIP